MRTCVWALLLSSLLVAPAQAQETRGTIQGTVRDAQGVVPGANVTITSLDTQASQQLITNGSGYFEAPLLQPGTYQVTVAMTGFKTLSQTGLVLAVGQQLSLALRIEVGQLAETVTVTADTPLLDTSSVSSGQNFDSRMVEGLPMFSNMPIMLTRFASGVNPSTTQSLVSQGFADGTTQAAGAAVGGVGSNNYSIDGATNSGSARRIAASPNSDMIQEMRVESSNFDASIGHGTGLQISMMTRAGANQYRGTANYQYLDEQVQRAEPEPAADLYPVRQGALRIWPFAQHRHDVQRARDQVRRQQALLLRQLLVRQRLHPRQEPGHEHGTRRTRRTSTETSPICSGCRTRRSIRFMIRSRCAPIRRIRTGSSAIRS